MKDKIIENQQENGLIFKEHREFFIKFFDKRDAFLRSFALAKYDNEELKESYLVLNYLIEATSSYIFPFLGSEDVDSKMKMILDCYDEKNFETCFNKIKELHREISTAQVKAEILPKPLRAFENKQEQFWKGEESKAMREMKKAFYDVVMKY